MVTITIELPDQEAAALQSRAERQGTSVSELIQSMATERDGEMMDWSRCGAVESVPGKVSGAWVLKDTRMPVAAIFENLEAGANIDDILEWFPGLDRAQVEEVIEFAARSLDRPPRFDA